MKNLQYIVLFLLVTVISSESFSQNLKKMNQIAFNEKGDLTIVPSKTSSPNDFDFLVGKWNIHNKKLKSKLNNSNEWIEFDAVQEMRKVLVGIEAKPYEGMAVRLFNPATRLWSIHWADNNSGAIDSPVTGSFENRIGTFFGRETINGRRLFCNLNGTRPMRKNQSGVRRFPPIKVEHGNGIGIGILPDEETTMCRILPPIKISKSLSFAIISSDTGGAMNLSICLKIILWNRKTF